MGSGNGGNQGNTGIRHTINLGHGREGSSDRRDAHAITLSQRALEPHVKDDSRACTIYPFDYSQPAPGSGGRDYTFATRKVTGEISGSQITSGWAHRHLTCH